MFKKCIALIAVMALALSMTMSVSAALPTGPVEVTVYVSIYEVNPADIMFGGNGPFTYTKASGTEVGQWGWENDFPSVESDRENFKKYQFTVTFGADATNDYAGIPFKLVDNTGGQYLVLQDATEKAITLPIQNAVDGKFVGEVIYVAGELTVEQTNATAAAPAAPADNAGATTATADAVPATGNTNNYVAYTLVAVLAACGFGFASKKVLSK